ncbi:hypothetical protein F5884DRAFT_49259 [Xylogone sp. PMI_703]|nr:hypothetical protein F5884DRAFT_49259 [Xylogone sp. PMI_703]
MDSVPNSQDSCGQIVAFEGDVDTIATQLQLIPFSSKILIIPSLESSLPRPKPSTLFDPHAYIHDVHTVLTARIEKARSFLKLSTPTQPRLVFLNGGTICARATCVRAICDNATDGDVREAERQFNEAVKDGLDGLLRSRPRPREEKEAEEEKGQEDEEEEQQQQRHQQLQPDTSNTTNDAEETVTAAVAVAAPSIPAPEPPAVRMMRSITPEIQTRGLAFQEFGHPSRLSADLMVEDRPESVLEDEPPSWGALTPKENLTSRMEKRTTFGGQIPSPVARRLRDTEEEEQSGDESDLDDFTSPLNSALVTEDVVFGEAYIVDVPSKYLRASSKRTKSAETIDVTITKPPDGTFGPGSPESGASDSPIVMRPFTADGRLQRKPSLPLFQLPKTTYDGSPATANEKTLLPSADVEPPEKESRPLGRRGTFSEDSAIDVTAGSSGKPHGSFAFEPVFPLLEDLVIQFKDGSSDDILESVIASYKDGSYPIIPQRRTILVPSPTSAVFSGYESGLPMFASGITVEVDEVRSHKSQGSNSHLSDGGDYPSEMHHRWPSQDEFGRSSTEGRGFGGLTAQTITPPSTANGISQKFCDFTYTNSSNAVHIQDSLRAVLDSYFPTNETGYSQGFSLIATGTDRLWKPVFGSIDDSTGSQRTTVDQIIAFGHEDGVDTDLFAHISGQIEALGMKRNGINKAGKLDLRYLVANVLQTAEEQSKRTGVRPWSNTKALATMLVPHLEAYLASNPMIGLLILHYPITHLSTVLALRKLIGADLFKVAGILDGLSSEPSFDDQPATILSSDLSFRTRSIFQRGRTDSIHSHYTSNSFSTRSTSQLPAHLRNRLSVISLSKADYLIPSTASPAEIKTLLSSIAQGLIERSSFYTPDPESSPAFCKPAPPIPDSPIENDRAHLRKKSRSRSNYTPSIISTRTTASERIRREEARERQLEKDWENFYLGEDSDDDYDRMVMGRSGGVVLPDLRKKARLEEMTKVGGKKAFKWLGLA